MSDQDDAQPAPLDDKSAEVTETPCRHHDCARPATHGCQYTDDTRDRCTSRWCDEHVEHIDDMAYCLRHAAVMDSLHDATGLWHKPPVRNRAASMVAWVSRDLDDGIRLILESVALDDESVETDGLRPIDSASGKGQAWRRTWRIQSEGFPKAIVALEVAEDADDTVIVSVLADVVSHRRAPWVRNRIEGRVVTVTEDVVERARYYQQLLRDVANGLAEHLRLSTVAVPVVHFAGLAQLATDDDETDEPFG